MFANTKVDHLDIYLLCAVGRTLRETGGKEVMEMVAIYTDAAGVRGGCGRRSIGGYLQ